MSPPLSFDDVKTRLASYQHTLDAAGVDGFEVSEEPMGRGFVSAQEHIEGLSAEWHLLIEKSGIVCAVVINREVNYARYLWKEDRQRRQPSPQNVEKFP